MNHVFISAKKEQAILDQAPECSSDSDSGEESEEEKDFEPMFGEEKRQQDLELELKEQGLEPVKVEKK